MFVEHYKDMQEFANEIIRKFEQTKERVDIGCASDPSLEELCALSDALLKMDYGCKFSFFKQLYDGKIAVYATITDLKPVIEELLDLCPWLRS